GTATTESGAAAIGERLAAHGGHGRALNVTDAAALDSVLDGIAKEFGPISILVNNAGIMIENPAQAPSEQSLDTWKRTFDTNVYALVAVTQAFLPLVKQAKSGRIVNVSSMLGSQTLHADPSSGIYHFKIPAYNASKAA
ncbi:SDR family NAD(P)-dependent oxidoreductase, partial [Corallococcus carmarthensis]|nr:SDR family NAD(P)-dependent oxidoreductase [Corallococcus carmarthensis]